VEVFSYRSRTSRLKQAPGASRAQKAGRKSEFFYLNEFGSIEQLADGIQGYIRYYNEERIQSETEDQSGCFSFARGRRVASRVFTVQLLGVSSLLRWTPSFLLMLTLSRT